MTSEFEGAEFFTIEQPKEKKKSRERRVSQKKNTNSKKVVVNQILFLDLWHHLNVFFKKSSGKSAESRSLLFPLKKNTNSPNKHMPFFLLGKFNPPIFLHQVLPAMISLFHFLKLPMDVTPTSLLENQPGIWTATRSKSLPRVSWMFRNINETYNWRVQNKTLPETKALRVFFPPEHGCLGLMTTFLFGMAGWLGRMFQGRLFVSGTFFIVKFR